MSIPFPLALSQAHAHLKRPPGHLRKKEIKTGMCQPCQSSVKYCQTIGAALRLALTKMHLAVMAARCSSPSSGRYMMMPTQEVRALGSSAAAGLMALRLRPHHRCSMGAGAPMPVYGRRHSVSERFVDQMAI